MFAVCDVYSVLFKACLAMVAVDVAQEPARLLARMKRGRDDPAFTAVNLQRQHYSHATTAFIPIITTSLCLN